MYEPAGPIDLSDIPETREEWFARATPKRPPLIEYMAKHLEPGIADMPRPTFAEAAALSSAVSLKRIADALQPTTETKAESPDFSGALGAIAVLKFFVQYAVWDEEWGCDLRTFEYAMKRATDMVGGFQVEPPSPPESAPGAQADKPQTDAMTIAITALEYYANPENWWVRGYNNIRYHQMNNGSVERMLAQIGNVDDSGRFWNDCGATANVALSAIKGLKP